MFIAVRTGLEPATPCVTGMYSNQAELPHHFIVSLLSLSIAVAKVGIFFIPAIVFGSFFEGVKALFPFTRSY